MDSFTTRAYVVSINDGYGLTTYLNAFADLLEGEIQFDLACGQVNNRHHLCHAHVFQSVKRLHPQIKAFHNQMKALHSQTKA